MEDKGLLLFGAAALAVLGVIGLGTGLRRMVVYGGLSLVISVAGHLAGLETYLPVLASGGGVLLAGAVLFVRFLRAHPARPDEGSAADGKIAHVP